MPGRAKKENENGLVLFWQWVQKAKAKQHKQCAHNKKSIFNRGEIMKVIDELMNSLPVKSRWWCGGGDCACMGCCNRLLLDNGYTEKDFESWDGEKSNYDELNKYFLKGVRL
jgi:hypothetical protein